MPKYGFMISRAVDLVARKLAGMEPDTIARLTKILSEEAQMISEELQYSGQAVDADILAARLEGILARMKYEVRNQGPDPSPHEFPIFNLSHNPAAPYPKPINHLYDKRYKEAYSTFIKQNPSVPTTPKTSEPSTPISPGSTAPKTPTTPVTSPPIQNQPNPLSGTQQQTGTNWYYMNPYATMPRSHAAYYQQQAANVIQPTNEQASTTSTYQVRRSSTGDDLRSNSLSRSASSTDLNYATDTGREKIRVRVIRDNTASSSTDPYKNGQPNDSYNTKKSILKPGMNDPSKELVTTQRIYAPSNTEMGTETVEDLLKVAKRQQSDPTGSTNKPMTERIIIIDRRGLNPTESGVNLTEQDRVRTFEIRSSTGEVVPTKSAPKVASTPLTPAITSTTPSNPYAFQQQQQQQQLANYYAAGQQAFYQPKVYMTMPSNAYSTVTPYVGGGVTYYPYTYYQYQ